MPKLNKKNPSDQFRNQLLPRTDKYKQLQGNQQVPRTTETKMVVPCLTKTFGFRTNEYNKYIQVLKDVIDKKQFDEFIKKANNIIEEEMIRKQQKQKQPFFNSISYLLQVCIGIAIIAFILLASVVYWGIAEQAQHIIIIVAAVLLGLSSLIAALCPIFLYRTKYEVHMHQRDIKARLDRLLMSENKKNIKDKRNYMMWSVQKNFFWLELHIDRVLLSMHKKVTFSGSQSVRRYSQAEQL